MSKLGKTKFTTRDVVILGILVAMNIVFTRLLSIQTATIRIGFGFIPIAVAGMMFGAFPAGIVAALGDVIGLFFNATGTLHLGITLNAFLTGFVFGLLLYKDRRIWRIVLAVAVNQGILSLFLQTYWLYGLYNMSGLDAYRALMVSRIPQTLIVGAAQLIVIPLLSQLVKRLNSYVTEEKTGMSEKEAIDYIENYTWSSTRFGLERTRELLKALGDPQKELKFIHVTGSNGKGSTCSMVDSILRQAGYRTGLYTSPYIQSFRERIRVDGEDIPAADLAAITDKVRVIAEKMADHPSQFELVTAIAMEYFRQAGCDIVVLEVGMGGALDATNAIDAPEVAVITNIGLEHTDYLGDTLEKIATVKSGIIKPGCHAVCYDGAPEVTEVVRAVCAEKNVPLTCVDFRQLEPVSETLEGQTFRWQGREYSFRLLGRHQLYNASVALSVVDALRLRGWKISDENVRTGLRLTLWPARLEVLRYQPLCILDGGHNPQCAQALTASLDELLPGRKVTFLMGILADKDYSQVVDMILPYAKEFFTLTPENPRALSAEDLAAELRSRGAAATACTQVEEGVTAAMEAAGEDGVVVIFGSLYLAGAVRTEFQKRQRVAKAAQRRACRAARMGLTAEERKEKSLRICQKLTELPEVRDAKTIFSYLAMPDEVDLDAFHKWAAEQGKTVAFPVTGDHGRMDVYVPESYDTMTMTKGRFNILTPDPEHSRLVPPEEIDLVLTPCVGFDDDRRRLGQGGGYYDRYLVRCPQAKRIAVAFAVQKVPHVVCDALDVSLDGVITEE